MVNKTYIKGNRNIKVVPVL